MSMSPTTSFWGLLWGDWGKHTALTSLGVPKVFTNLIGYLLISYISYLLVERYYPESKETLNAFVHNPFIVAAYILFYISSIIYKYAENRDDPAAQKAGRSKRRLHTAARLSWVGFIWTLVLFLICALQSR